MTLGNGFPGHSALATFADVRRDLEGAVVRNAAGVMRAGIFPAHFDPLVTGRADMKVNIADFRAVLNRAGAIFLANVGTDATVQLDAAPAANRRIDLIYVTQRSTTLGDAASTPTFGVVKGTASASPVVPALPPAVADALPLATVEIPAGATTTNSAGVVRTQVYPYTAMAGGTVVVRNSVELAAWTPADGAHAFNLADTGEYVRSGGEWRLASSVEYTLSPAANFTLLTGSAVWDPLTRQMRVGFALRNNTVPADGAVAFTIQGAKAAAATCYGPATALEQSAGILISARVAGTTVTLWRSASGAPAVSSAISGSLVYKTVV